MVKMIKKAGIYAATSIFPFILPQTVFAEGVTDIIRSTFDIVTNILIPIAFSLCLLYFFWGVAKYIGSKAGSEEAVNEGKRIMFWGIIGLFVAASIWGIISFIQGELRLPDDIKTISV